MLTPDCGRRSAATDWATCSLSRPTGACPPQRERSGPIGCPRCCPRGPGRSTPPERETTGNATTPGRGSTYYLRTTPTPAATVCYPPNDATGELAYLRCYSPHSVTLHSLVTVAGQRWRIEESFQAAKGLAGIDQHQVRRWTSWHRWTTLAMLAHAFLAVATASERETTSTPTGLIALTVNEFRRLFDALLLATHHTITSLMAWSRWRRRHQYRARLSHYRRRENQ